MPLLLIGSAALLSACSKPEPAPASPAEIIRPALIQQVGAAEPVAQLRLPGRLRAVKRAELSFNVPGSVVDFAWTEGSRVKAGQVVARLDDAVFKARANAAQVEFEHAKGDLDRYQRLWETEQAVARSEVEDRRNRLEVARTSLAAAQQDLADTLVRAPFSGVLTRRRIETFANVQAKQAVAELQDLSALEVVIHVPQRLLRNEGSRTTALVFFEDHAAEPVPAVLKSFATDADPLTQTYEVVLALKSRPNGLKLLPGMPVTVRPSAALPTAADAALSIPLSAVASDAKDSHFVWVVDSGGQVARVGVALGEVRADRVVVVSGLNAGERIVTAGTHALRDGMKVRPLEAR